MIKGEGLSALLFRIVCLSFSAVLLVTALFSQILTVRTESRVDELRQRIARAENESVLLKIKAEQTLNLEELERRAVQELGMRHPEPGQIRIIEYMG
jgi:Cell division protein FtsL.